MIRVNLARKIQATLIGKRQPIDPHSLGEDELTPLRRILIYRRAEFLGVDQVKAKLAFNRDPFYPGGKTRCLKLSVGQRELCYDSIWLLLSRLHDKNPLALKIIIDAMRKISSIEKSLLKRRLPILAIVRSGKRDNSQSSKVVQNYEEAMVKPLQLIDAEIDVILRVFGLTKNSKI